MQKNIRQGIFETNSSSTHVIVVDKDNVKYKKELHLSAIWDDSYIKERFVLHLRSYEWRFEWLDYAEAKLSYLMTYAIQSIPCSTEEQVNDVIDKIWQGETAELDISYNDLVDLVDFIKEYAVNAKDVDGLVVRFEYSNWCPNIDHQSCNGNIEQMLHWKAHDMSMAEFVFNPAVRMRISNDNEEDEELEEALRHSKYPEDYDYEDYDYADN